VKPRSESDIPRNRRHMFGSGHIFISPEMISGTLDMFRVLPVSARLRRTCCGVARAKIARMLKQSPSRIRN
jgi:hypothetical protein